MPSTTTFTYRIHWDPNPKRASQRTIVPPNPESTRIFEHTTHSYPRISHTASRVEIYSLAFGTCFLALLLGWLLLLGIHNTIKSFSKPSKTRQMDPGGSGIAERKGPEGQSFLSHIQNVSTGQFIMSTRRKSAEIATGLTRDMSELRRTKRPTCHGDEEAALGEAEGGGTGAEGPFLHHSTRQMAGASSV